MKTRIAIYGGTDLPDEWVRFVRRLTRALIEFDDVVILSGGFEHFKKYPNRISVDLAVLSEAEERLSEEQFDQRFETWIPAPNLDRRSVKRFKKGTVHELVGTAQARRFKLVEAADAIVTISGEGNTRTVLELALAVEKPALPVDFTGTDSHRIWKRYRADLIRALRLAPRLVGRLEKKPTTPRQLDTLASDLAAVIHDAAQKRCLVLMPFGRGHDGFYSDFLRPAILAANYLPHRIDKDDYAGHIPSLFLSSLQRARAVVIDLTGVNPNVMYELGQVHARGINPLLIFRARRSGKRAPALPFYLRHEKLISQPDEAAGHRRIAGELIDYLRSLTKTGDAERRRS